MEAPPPIHASPQKRPHTFDAEVSTPTRNVPSTASTPLTVVSSLETPSPLKPFNAEAAPPTSSANPATGEAPAAAQPALTSSNDGQPAKRRKLTSQEKEEQAREKEAKAKARAEQKAQKEEEKRIKDEEKRKKNEEKEEKKRAKELKQQQIEEEKRKKEEEKRKKDNAQMKLNAFFIKPKVATESAGNTTVEPIQRAPIGQTSLPTDAVVAVANSAPPSPQKAVVKNAHSDYERFFLPFAPPPYAIVAPSSVLFNRPQDLAAAQSRLEDILTHKDASMKPVTLESLRTSFPKRRRGLKTITIEEILVRVNGSADNPIDLTGDHKAKPLDLLKQIPMKYLHFGEDVRPPYYGTYTKPHDPRQERKVARNPTSRSLSDLNYDYDSEAEWEEPGEGEDLDTEGEEDLDDEDDEDLDGFLDDNDDSNVKRKLLNGDQEPVSTGLCWEDASGVSRLNDGSGAISTEFKEFQMGFLLEPQPHSIDPFSTAYWAPEPSVAPSTGQPIRSDANGMMNPPRLPLTSRPVNGLLNTLNASQKTPSGTGPKAARGPRRTVPPELLPAFKAAIDGKDLTKLAMIETLKKQFPKVTKDAIENTLVEVAKRVGPSQQEKRWVLLN